MNSTLPTAFRTALLTALVIGCRETPSGSDTRQPVLSESPENAAAKPERTESEFVSPPHVASDYIGSESCRACHAGICDEFALHPMGRSITRELLPEDATQAAPNFTSTAGLLYEVAQDDQRVVHHEKLLDENGTVVFDRSEPIDFGIGSGRRGRGFGFTRAGRIYLSPITWYTHRARWDLSPGYNAANNPGFERKASDGCMACHAGRMDTVAGARDQFGERLFLEASIGCERCHGPGGRHAEFRRTNTGQGHIVNPAALESSQRDAVCFQCHLQGERRVVRYGRTDYDFRPGMNLNEIWVTFLKSGAAEEQSAEAVSHVEQMLSSRCYQQSDGAFGCVSCHDPHSVPTPPARESFYRQRCRDCHDGPDAKHCLLPVGDPARSAKNDSCIACHMPPLAASDVPHTAQTDHSVSRRPGNRATSAGSGIPKEDFLPVIFQEAGYSIPAHELSRAKIILMAESSSARKDQFTAYKALELLKDLGAPADNDADLFEAIGLLKETTGEPQEAEKAWKQALTVRPRDEAIIELLATMHHSAGNMYEARTYYRQLVESNDSRPTYYGRLAHVLGQTGQLTEGIEAAKTALRLNPALPQAHGWLAEAYQVLGDQERSRYHQQQAEEQIRVRRLRSTPNQK